MQFCPVLSSCSVPFNLQASIVGFLGRKPSIATKTATPKAVVKTLEAAAKPQDKDTKIPSNPTGHDSQVEIAAKTPKAAVEP